MKFVGQILRFVLGFIKTIRLALPKIGVGWMFALLTINFNRITIVELDIAAIAVTTMLAMHYFLSPFQVISGRIADRYPILGYRRTPYILIGSVSASLIFLTLPSVAQAMGAGSSAAYAVGFGVLIVFGIAMAMIGDSHHSLIAEVTTPRARGGVISVVWSFSILSTIIAAGVMSSIMPEYTPESMQQLYNLTPFVVIGATLLGVIGMEKRLTGDALEESLAKAKAVAPDGNPIQAALHVLSSNPQARAFFAFIFVSILAIFLQDNILEPFGAEVFGMGLTETNKFQPTWGGGVLIGMAIMGLISVVFSVSKRWIAVIGCAGTAVGMIGLSTSALLQAEAGISPSLMFMGLFTGFFNVGALAMMMDMTIEGATGLYMGLWGVAQAFGNGLASIGGGALHTGLIETSILSPNLAYTFIFGLEAAGMAIAGIIMWHLSVSAFYQQHESSLNTEDTLRAMEVGAVA